MFPRAHDTNTMSVHYEMCIAAGKGQERIFQPRIICRQDAVQVESPHLIRERSSAHFGLQAAQKSRGAHIYREAHYTSNGAPESKAIPRFRCLLVLSCSFGSVCLAIVLLEVSMALSIKRNR